MWIILSSAFLAVFLLIRALFSNKIKSTAMYALWILVAVRLLVPTYIPVELDIFSNNNLSSVAYQITAVEESRSGYLNDDASTTVNNSVVVDTSEPTGASNGALSDTEQSTKATHQLPVHPLLLIWIIGVAFFAIYFAVSNIRFHNSLKKNRVKIEKYSYKIPVYFVQGLPSPCMTGIFHPAIYVNEQIQGHESDRYVLDHEYIHYKHKDSIWMLVQTICLCIHWYNPLVWVASALFRRDCECACDETLTKEMSAENRIMYGRTLLTFSEEKWHVKSFFSTATSMSMEGKTMKKRVHVIVNHPPKRVISSVIAILLAVTLFIGAFVVNSSEKESSVDNGWNATYIIEGTDTYWSFYPDGTAETISNFNYSLTERNNERIFDLISSDNSNGSYVVKRTENGCIQMIPEMIYFMDEDFGFDISVEDATSEYMFADGIDGITSNDYFSGIYHNTKLNQQIGVAGFEFFDDGTCQEFVRFQYQVLNNHEIKIGNTTYQCLIENDGDLLKLWTKEGEGTLNLVKVGLAQSINVEIIGAGVFQDYAKCGSVTYTTDSGETETVIPISLYYSLWIENNSCNDLRDLDFKIIANEEFESFLIKKMKIDQEDLIKYYNSFESALHNLSGSSSTINQLDSQSRSSISFSYDLAYDQESLIKNGVLKAENNKSNVKDITDYVYDVTLVIYNDGKELTRVDLSKIMDSR